MNRAFTFNQPKIIDRLNKEFVPFSGNTIELQTDYGAEYSGAKWFMPMSNQTQCHVQGQTTQGMYISGADGTAYCWKNTPGITATLRFMDEGLKAFKERPPKTIEIDEKELKEKFSRAPRESTSVIEVYSRVRPIPEGADSRNANIGRDYLWIYDDEIKEIAAAADRESDSFDLPEFLVARIVRYGLVDIIRGEPDYWESKEVRHAEFSATRISSDDAQATVGFHGKFGQATVLLLRGLEGHIDGQFTIDKKTNKVSHFRAYAKCEAWGASTWSTRGVPAGKFPLVFGMVDVNDAVSKDVPPGAVSRDRPYRHPTMK